MAAKQIITKADEVRGLLEALSNNLDKQGFFLRSVHFERDEETQELKNVRMSYAEKGGE